MMRNINRVNREQSMEHKSINQPWLYHNRFKVTANRMKKWKIVQNLSFLKYQKMLHKNDHIFRKSWKNPTKGH